MYHLLSVDVVLLCSLIYCCQYRAYDFYRAKLRPIVVFAVGQCLSVTFVYCILMAEDTVKHLPRPGSPIILRNC